MSGRRRALSVLGATAALLAFAPGARAMGGADCAPEDLVPVDAWIAAHPWRVGPVNPSGLVASACKQASGADKRLAIVVAAYDLAIANQKSVVVALVDFDAGVVRAAWKGTIAEDAWLQVTQGVLGIDTAPYDLAPGVRAFGVDVATTSPGTTCVDSGVGPLRALFVRDGALLRPVLARFDVSSWRFTKGNPVCEPESAKGSVIETTTSTIAIAPHATHGFADLVVSESIEGRVSGRKVHGRRYELHYDGTAYRRGGNEIDDSVFEPEAAARP